MILRGRDYQSGRVQDYHLADGLIAAIADPALGGPYVGGEDLWVAPGLIDVQVNGYGGHDFCNSEGRVEDVVDVAEALTAAGVTSFCPTVTTNSHQSMSANLRTIAAAWEASPLVRERVLGVHLEGPFISPADGPRGAHPSPYVRVPDWNEFCKLQEAAGGHIRLVTLAPELSGALGFIARARAAGVLVALGHHSASAAEIQAALAAGAVMATHLGNGAHATLPRHPNYLWEQIANDDLCASIIVDGHHLPASVVKTIFRAKGPACLILVSDAIWTAGMPAGVYDFMGMSVELCPDGAVRLVGTPYLAGSTLKLSEAVANVMRMAGATLAEAIQMASTNPARLLGVAHERGLLGPGVRADLVAFREGPAGPLLALTIAGGQLCCREGGE